MPTINDTLARLLLDGLDGAFNSGTLTIRTGAAPGANNAESGTVLSTIPLPTDSFSAASGRTKSGAMPWQDLSIDNSGTAGHWRLVGGSAVMEGSVGVGTGELQLSTLTFVQGGTVTITAFEIGTSNAGA